MVTFRNLGPVSSLQDVKGVLRDVEAMLLELCQFSNTPVDAANLVGDTLASGIIHSSLATHGTYTPTLLLGGTPVTSYTQQVGTWTKIEDDRVLISARVVVNVVGAGAGGVTIGGLPFTVGSLTNSYHSVSVVGNNLVGLTNESLAGYFLIGGTSANVSTFLNGMRADLNNTNIGVGSALILAGHYKL